MQNGINALPVHPLELFMPTVGISTGFAGMLGCSDLGRLRCTLCLWSTTKSMASAIFTSHFSLSNWAFFQVFLPESAYRRPIFRCLFREQFRLTDMNLNLGTCLPSVDGYRTRTKYNLSSFTLISEIEQYSIKLQLQYQTEHSKSHSE